jgi:flagellar motility protein MotE (MotC chaperone)
LIQAYSLLEAVGNELGFARHQLALVRDQYEALREAEKENATRAESLQEFLDELLQLAEDPRTIQATINSLKLSGQKVLAFVDALESPKPDPFLLFRGGKLVERELRSVRDRISGDWEAHKLATKSETSAEAALSFCHQFIREAQTDKITNSRALDRAIQRHADLSNELKTIELTLKSDHADWHEVFTEVARIEGETAKVQGTMKDQLAAARNAAVRIRQASRSISALQKWSSSYSVRANQKAGNKEFYGAEAALSNGDYAEARRLAVSSEGASKRELQRAKTKESREAAKAALSFSSSSSRSSWGSGSSFSSSSSSSGFSGSSFSSGSGFSRSGW